LQLEFLLKNTSCKTIWVWGRNPEKAKQFKESCPDGLTVHLAANPAEVARNTNLIVTTTPAESPLLHADDIRPGTHITAVGSDTSKKQELAGEILKKADLVIADSLSQSKSRGEIYKAVKEGAISPGKVIEIGTALQDANLQRTDERQITVVDLTGVAVQDIMIAKKVYTNYLNKKQTNEYSDF